MNKVYWNNRIIAAEAAKLSVHSEAVRFGEGVFTTLKIHNGRPRFFLRHWQRFVANAARFGWERSWNKAEIEEALCELVRIARLNEGVGRLSLHPEGEQVHLLATVAPPRRAPLASGEGLSVCRYPEPVQIPSVLHGVKSNNYLLYRLAKAHAIREQCDDAVLCDQQGNIIEASCANLFLVRAGCLQTPPLSSGALPGIIRALVLEIAAASGIRHSESLFHWSALQQADELFLTNSLYEIAPVSHIRELDRHLVTGPVTSLMAEALSSLSA